MLLILNPSPRRTLRLRLKCARAGCDTRVDMAGPEDDPILRGVWKWGSSCPKCGGDLDVVSVVSVPTPPDRLS